MATTKAPSTPSRFTLHRGYRQALLTLIYLALSATAIYGMWIIPQRWNLNDQIFHIIDNGTHLQGNYPLRYSFTGSKQLDYALRFITVVFLPAADDYDRAFYLQTVHFLLQFFAVIAVWSVESERKRNAGAIFTYTSIWAIFYQSMGGAVIIPLALLSHLYLSHRTTYFDPWTRDLPISPAKTLLFSLILGYLIPTLAMLTPWPNKDDKQIAIALWQVSPILVNFIWVTVGWMDAFSHPRLPERGFPPVDYDWLQVVYRTAFAICTLSHLAICGYCLFSNDPSLSLYNVFIPNLARANGGFVQGIHWNFQVDWWVIFAATGVWCVSAIWDLNLLGRSAIGVFAAVVTVAVGSVVVGPGSMLALVWSWREFKMIEMEGNLAVKESKAQ